MPDTAAETAPDTASANIETQISTPLSEVWKAGMDKRDAERAKGDAAGIAETAKPAVKAREVAIEAKIDPMEAVIAGKPAEQKEAEVKPADEIPHNAPAKQLRDALHRREAEVHTLKAEVEKLRATKPETQAQLESLTKEREQWHAEQTAMKEKMIAVNVELSDEFQGHIAERKTLVEKAAAKLTGFGGDGAALAEALALPEGKMRNTAIKEAIGELDDLDRQKVIAVLDRLDAKDETMAELRTNSKQSWEKMSRAQQEAAQKAAQENDRLKGAEFDRVAKTLPEKFILARQLPDDAEGAKDWNATFTGAVDNARRLLGAEATYAEVSEAAVAAGLAPKYEALWIEERTARLAAQKQLAAYEKAEPGVRSGGGKAPGGGALDKTPGQLYREGMARRSGAQV